MVNLLNITGQLAKIRYKNDDNQYTVAQFIPDEISSKIIVTGYLVGVKEGECFELTGSWEKHSKYGQQFKIEVYKPLLPETIESIKEYLKALDVRGLSRQKINALVKEFGDETLQIIDTEPDRIESVKGFGKILSAGIIEAWARHNEIRKLINFFQEYDIPVSFCAQIYQTYGSSAIDIIKEKTFSLFTDFQGISFEIVDAVAQKLGYEKNDPQRIGACILHLLDLIASDGHVYTLKGNLVKRCIVQFGIDPELISQSLDELHDTGQVVIDSIEEAPDESVVYAKDFYLAEVGIANTLKVLNNIPTENITLKKDEIIEEVLRRLAIQLADEQLEALEDIIAHKVAIITGGPGTGKTTLVKSVTAIYKKLGRKIVLAAPTGRAARRLSEVTHEEASTIHKMLHYNFRDGTFDKNRDDTLDVDVVIVDEASMIDVLLMYHLLNAVPLTASVILVGDIFQLPSVGPGTVLSDLIQSKQFRTFELTKIFRQVEESPIIINSHRVRNGEAILLDKHEKSDKLAEFYFIETANPIVVMERIVDICCKRIPEKYGLDPMTEVQVLTPMHKGDVGTISLNNALQKELNSETDKIESFGRSFKEGDKVMHLKNNYEKEVFNGDIGIIESLDKSLKTLTVNYYGRNVDYEFDELDELTLAYAISVHKSQGSEYPAVVVPITTQHFSLLQRNLLYTAMTRGKKLVILIGTEKALKIALNNDRPKMRMSGLEGRLLNIN